MMSYQNTTHTAQFITFINDVTKTYLNSGLTETVGIIPYPWLRSILLTRIAKHTGIACQIDFMTIDSFCKKVLSDPFDAYYPLDNKTLFIQYLLEFLTTHTPPKELVTWFNATHSASFQTYWCCQKLGAWYTEIISQNPIQLQKWEKGIYTPADNYPLWLKTTWHTFIEWLSNRLHQRLLYFNGYILNLLNSPLSNVIINRLPQSLPILPSPFWQDFPFWIWQKLSTYMTLHWYGYTPPLVDPVLNMEHIGLRERLSCITYMNQKYIHYYLGEPTDTKTKETSPQTHSAHNKIKRPSLNIHIHHNPRREVEFLYDVILNFLNDNPKCMPEDIAIITTNDDVYTPLLCEIYDAHISKSKFYLPLDTQSSIEKNDIIIRTLVTAMETLCEEPTAKQIMDILNTSLFHKLLNINPTICNKYASWLNNNAAFRMAQDKTYTQRWQHALDQLMLAVFYPPMPYNLYQGYSIGDTIKNEYDIIHLEKLLFFVEQCAKLQRYNTQKQTFKVWYKNIYGWLNDFYGINGSNKSMIDTIIETLHKECYTDKYEANIEISFRMALKIIYESYPSTIYHYHTLYDGIKVHSIQNPLLDTVKFVAILGSQDIHIPTREEIINIYQTKSPPLFPEISSSLKQSHTLYHLMQNTNSHLHISYVGYNKQDNTPIPDNTYLRLLKTLLTKEYQIPLDTIIQKHPLYNPEIKQPSHTSTPSFKLPKPDKSNVMTLSDLYRFLNEPTRTWYHQNGGITTSLYTSSKKANDVTWYTSMYSRNKIAIILLEWMKFYHIPWSQLNSTHITSYLSNIGLLPYGEETNAILTDAQNHIQDLYHLLLELNIDINTPHHHMPININVNKNIVQGGISYQESKMNYYIGWESYPNVLLCGWVYHLLSCSIKPHETILFYVKDKKWVYQKIFPCVDLYPILADLCHVYNINSDEGISYYLSPFSYEYIYERYYKESSDDDVIEAINRKWLGENANLKNIEHYLQHKIYAHNPIKEKAFKQVAKQIWLPFFHHTNMIV